MRIVSHRIDFGDRFPRPAGLNTAGQKFGGYMNMRAWIRGLFHPAVVRAAVVMLAALGWSSSGFCGPIHEAAQQGDVAAATALLQNNSRLAFSKDEDGDTPLHLAARMGHIDMVKLLVAHKADVNAKDRIDDTPLHLAALDGHAEVVELLLGDRADVNAKDSDSNTPLHLAARTGQVDVAKLLVAHKAEINARNKDGDTPLHLAAAADQLDVVTFLLTQKITVNSRNDVGNTPLNAASKSGYKDIVDILRQHGGH
jgi:ankyrin repeat protein